MIQKNQSQWESVELLAMEKKLGNYDDCDNGPTLICTGNFRSAPGLYDELVKQGRLTKDFKPIIEK